MKEKIQFLTVKEKIQILVQFGMTLEDATDFCYCIAEDGFEAGKESERQSLPTDILKGELGRDGFYFGDWFTEQTK